MIVQDKTYHISASVGKKIKITFAAFNLEEKPSWTNSCAFDYLKVTGKVSLGQRYKVRHFYEDVSLQIVDSNGVTILGESCGSEKPAEVTTQTNQ